MTPILLFRKDLDSEHEATVASKYMPVVYDRMDIVARPNSLVVCRYSCLPYYQELDEALQRHGSRIVNTYNEHTWIADVTAWAMPGGALYGMTPKTYTAWGPNLPEGAYVVKGKTNSRKQDWNRRMFCPTREDVPHVARILMDNTMIWEQELVVREYVPLKTFGEGLNGLPITNEHRLFFWAHTNASMGKEPMLLAEGFYWGSHPEYAEHAHLTPAGVAFAMSAARKVASYATFFVLDIAETADGRWILIEVNDGAMSGISMCDPDTLYKNLANAMASACLPVPTAVTTTSPGPVQIGNMRESEGIHGAYPSTYIRKVRTSLPPGGEDEE